MSRSASGPEKPPGQFDNLQAFLDFARSRCDSNARIPFTQPNGTTAYLFRDQAIAALSSLSRFLAYPERESVPALDDGRMLVAHMNHANLTQHLRWQSGLDSDSRPRNASYSHRTAPSSSLEAKSIPWWPPAAQLWFWAHGGPPLEGESGTYDAWLKKVRGERAQSFNVQDAGNLTRELQEVPF